jgi:hypothetical protein
MGLNDGDYRLLQKLLPLFSPDVTRINDLVGFVRRNGTVCYFNYQMPIYHHREDDMASFKVFLCQLVVIGNATPSQIKRTFRLGGRELNHWIKQYRQEGPGVFYGNVGQIKLKGVVDIHLHPLLAKASKWLRSIGHFSLKLKKQISEHTGFMGTR